MDVAAASATSRAPIEIPIKGKDNELLEINFEELPDIDDLLAILRQERASIDIWRQLAVRCRGRASLLRTLRRRIDSRHAAAGRRHSHRRCGTSIRRTMRPS